MTSPAKRDSIAIDLGTYSPMEEDLATLTTPLSVTACLNATLDNDTDRPLVINSKLMKRIDYPLFKGTKTNPNRRVVFADTSTLDSGGYPKIDQGDRSDVLSLRESTAGIAKLINDSVTPKV